MLMEIYCQSSWENAPFSRLLFALCMLQLPHFSPEVSYILFRSKWQVYKTNCPLFSKKHLTVSYARLQEKREGEQILLFQAAWTDARSIEPAFRMQLQRRKVAAPDRGQLTASRRHLGLSIPARPLECFSTFRGRCKNGAVFYFSNEPPVASTKFFLCAARWVYFPRVFGSHLDHFVSKTNFLVQDRN